MLRARWQSSPDIEAEAKKIWQQRKPNQTQHGVLPRLHGHEGQMDDDYMTRLSEATGLRRYQPREYKVEMIGDAVVGVKDGYIVAAGQSDENEMRIFVRFQPGVDESAFESAIKNISVESGRDLD